MAKQIILLVHGMGTHAKGAMKKEFQQALKDRADSFGLDSTKLLAKVECVEFNYSDYFDVVRKQFEENAKARKKGFGYLTGKGFEESLIKQLNAFESNYGKDEFFYTHWLDVILYSTMYFGEKLRVDFIKQYAALTKKPKGNFRNVHIICHSLGTSLVHDALAKYFRKESMPFDDIPDVPLGQFNMPTLWTFANVSRMTNILNNLADPLSSTVVTGNEGCTNRLFNVRNKFDPFTWFKTYDRAMNDAKHLVIETVRKANTHDFYEYITEPEVARGIIQIIYETPVTTAQFNKGKLQYEEEAITEDVKELKDMVRAVANDPTITGLKEAVEKFKKIREKIEELEGEV